MSESFLVGDPQPLSFADTHPAWCAAHGRRANRLAVGASVVGPSHIRRYRARDDAFGLMAAGEHMVVAVADGVGGEKYSRIGAAHCVNVFCRDLLARMAAPHIPIAGVDDFDPATLRRDLAALGVPRVVPTLLRGGEMTGPAPNWDSGASYHWYWNPYRRSFPTDLYEDDDPPPPPPALSDAVVESLKAVRESFFAQASTLRRKPREFACTFLTVAVNLTTGHAVAAQLGDGAILSLQDLMPACPSPPQNGEDNPFTMADQNWLEGLRIAEPTATGFLLMTDGAQDFFPEMGASCREVLTGPGDDARRALGLLEWLQGLVKPNCEDDRTLVAIMPD